MMSNRITIYCKFWIVLLIIAVQTFLFPGLVYARNLIVSDLFETESEAYGVDTLSAPTVGPDGSVYYAFNSGGGIAKNGLGTVVRFFKSLDKWKPERITVFYGESRGSRDGSNPETTPIFGADGNLYGTTYAGGASDCGVLYSLIKSETGKWVRKNLYSFRETASTPCNPTGKLFLQPDGSIIGTSRRGGNPDFVSTSGTVFRVTLPSETQTKPLVSVIAVIPEKYKFDITQICGLAPIGSNAFFVAACGRFISAGLFKITKPASGKGLWDFEFIHAFEDGRNDGRGLQNPIVAVSPREVVIVTKYGGRFAGSSCGSVFSDGRCGTAVSFKNENGKWVRRVMHHFRDLKGANGVRGFYYPTGIYKDPTSPGSYLGTAEGGGSTNWGGIFRLSPPLAPSTEWRIETLRSFPEFNECCTGMTTSSRTIYGVRGAIPKTFAFFSISRP